MTIDYKDVKTRVKAGAKLLDDNLADWYTLIDLNTLDLSDSYDCVLGQLYGDVSEGLNELGDPYASDYGFDITNDWDEYPLLNKAWTRQIEKRLNRQRNDVSPRAAADQSCLDEINHLLQPVGWDTNPITDVTRVLQRVQGL